MNSCHPAFSRWVVLLVFVGVLGTHGRGAHRDFKARCISDTRLAGQTLVVWHNVTSKFRCLTRCFSHSECESINYSNKMQECQLSSTAIGKTYIGVTGDGDYSYCGPEEGEYWGEMRFYEDSTHKTSSETTTTRITTTTPVTTTPRVTTTQQVTTTPRVATTQEVTTTLKVTTTPRVTTTPQVTTTPRVTTTQEVTTTLKVTTTPRVTTTPQVTTTPRVTTTPQVTTTAATTADVSATYYCTNKPASGVYTIHYEGSAVEGVEVYCDMDTDGGGWIVFQRRTDASVDFYQNHQSYADGFGDINGNFWLGNQLLHDFTSTGQWQLRVNMKDWVGGVAYAQYDVFSIGASPGFRLNVGEYSGTAGDSLAFHNNFDFTTNDYDCDGASGGNCAVWLNGGWWYGYCHQSALNGNYLVGGGVTEADQGLQWMAWKGNEYSLKETEMKIRPLTS